MNILVVFDTQTGTTQYVAEVIQKELQAKGHTIALHNVRANGTEPKLEGVELLMVGAPTYDDGKLEQSMKVFTTKFNPDLSKLKVAVFGLGNSTYPQFCTAADILTEWVTKNKGVPLAAPLRVDGFPDDLTPIQKWLTDTIK
jgi:MioC protein